VEFLGAWVRSKPHILGMVLMSNGSLEELLMRDSKFPVDWVWIGAHVSDTEGTNEEDDTQMEIFFDNLKVVMAMLIGASAGLVHCHNSGVLHRDVAARNFLVDQRNNVCISDFGMSQVVKHDGKGLHMDGKRGEPLPIAWCSPETLQKSAWSDKSDVYSFGVTLCEVLSRQEPYRGLDLVQDVAPGVCKKSDPLKPTLKAAWPVELVELICDCLAFSAADRPTSNAVNERLRRYQTRLEDADSLPKCYHPYKESSPSSTVASTGDSNGSTYQIVSASKYYVSYHPF